METFTLSPTLSHLNGWEKKNHLIKRGKKVFHSINQCLFVMSFDDQGFSSCKLAAAIFPPSAFCHLVRSKRVLRFHTYCYQIQWFLNEVICWNESIWSAHPLYACVCLHVIYSTIFIIRQLKIHIFPCSWFSIAKGASVTTLQDKARDSQAKFRCSHLEIIHIVIQFPHTDPCAWT